MPRNRTECMSSTCREEEDSSFFTSFCSRRQIKVKHVSSVTLAFSVFAKKATVMITAFASHTIPIHFHPLPQHRSPAFTRETTNGLLKCKSLRLTHILYLLGAVVDKTKRSMFALSICRATQEVNSDNIALRAL